MSLFTLEATARTDMGKGASRRLRRLEQQIPAILYGGEKKPAAIMLSQRKVNKTLEDERIYATVFDLNVDGKKEQVILKDIHRHPYKALILHMDFQRVSSKDMLVKHIPLHFINEQSSKAVKAGGLITHTMTQIEVRCLAKDLPASIEVNLGDLVLDQVIHLADLKLPKGVQLTVDLKDASHNHPVVSAHAQKAGSVAETPAAPAEEVSPEEPSSEPNS